MGASPCTHEKRKRSKKFIWLEMLKPGDFVCVMLYGLILPEGIFKYCGNNV